MASVVNWSADSHTLRKALLQLSKHQLIAACKHKNVTYSTNKKETIDRLLQTAENDGTTREHRIPSSLQDRIKYYEQKDQTASKGSYKENKHGKHVTRFSNHELEAVGLQWLKLKPLQLNNLNVPSSDDVEIVESPESDQEMEKYTQNTIRPMTTHVADWAHYQAFDEVNDQTLKEELNKKIESYGTFEVMSSLLFGFAVSVAFQNVNNSHFEKNDMGYNIAEIAFTLVIIVVLICNAYTMVVLSLTYFYVHRYMADHEYIMATIYLKIYAGYRKYARRSFYVGLVCFIAAIGIYLIPLLQQRLSQLFVFIFLGTGLIIIIYTLVTMTNPSRIVDRTNAGHKKFLSRFIEKGGMNEKSD